MRIKKKHVLGLLFLILSLMTVSWAYLVLSNPSVDKVFSLAYSEEATERIELSAGDFVIIELSTIPPGVSGRDAKEYVIMFYVSDPNGQKALDTLGIAGRVWLWPLTLLAKQDGVYTMHFENTLGSSIDKTVSLSYRITKSVLGISIERLLLYMSIITILLILMVIVIMLRHMRAGVGT